ncbi:DUF6262 family protein [Nocardia sp. NBC_01009]|uniref:DUF6262 family protein n=1 Tax=Nocardia sp. NBC_01009 TaxID=2975996 RepID=UPI003865BE6D|nr:DUF6262 family protein [Nocardia sp. NBC_01009]
MRADNTDHLKAAAKLRHEQARRRAIDVIDHLEATGAAVTIAGLARAAGVARSWLYTQPDLLARIKTTTPNPPTNKPPRSGASDESWQRRLELAHQRIKELTEENKQLRTQLAMAHGQRRADQITAIRTPSITQST